MKIAFVHELLTMRGGAERVLKVLADLYPQAPIYTLLYDEKKLGEWFPKKRIRVSRLQKIAKRLSLIAGRSAFNHHFFLPFFPRAVEAWDFSEFDLVISSSSAFAHNIITNGKPRHLSYIHSPARYLWDRTHEVMERATFLSRTFHKLRTWDSESADRADVLLAASQEVQRRIELYWRRPSTVLYPPIDDFWLEQNRQSPIANERLYFLLVSTLVPYKRIDLAVEACNKLKVPLIIAGEGPARRSLERIAKPNVQFVGYRSQEQLAELYTHAIATIFPGNEDFGLVPLESMACGTPVVAYRKGGALETVLEGETGEFFEEQSAESLVQTLTRLQMSTYASETCRAQAARFSRKKFEQGLQEHIAKVLSK